MRFGLPLRFGLRCECPRCQIASDSGRAMRTTKVQMALGQKAGCPRVNRAKKFMCSPRNTGSINFSLWLTGGLLQGCPDFQKVDVFKVYVPFSCPRVVFVIFVIFVIPVGFVKSTKLQNIGLAKPRVRNTRVSAPLIRFALTRHLRIHQETFAVHFRVLADHFSA